MFRIPYWVRLRSSVLVQSEEERCFFIRHELRFFVGAGTESGLNTESLFRRDKIASLQYIRSPSFTRDRVRMGFFIAQGFEIGMWVGLLGIGTVADEGSKCVAP